MPDLALMRPRLSELSVLSQTVHGGRVFALLTSATDNVVKPDRWDDTHTVRRSPHHTRIGHAGPGPAIAAHNYTPLLLARP